MSEPVGVSGNQLRAIIERIEHVEEEIKALAETKKEFARKPRSARTLRARGGKQGASMD
jgi:uncharacterized protein (UPF0335 family)